MKLTERAGTDLFKDEPKKWTTSPDLQMTAARTGLLKARTEGPNNRKARTEGPKNRTGHRARSLNNDPLSGAPGSLDRDTVTLEQLQEANIPT